MLSQIYLPKYNGGKKISLSKSGGNYWREADYILVTNQVVAIWDLLMKTKIVITNMWLK